MVLSSLNESVVYYSKKHMKHTVLRAFFIVFVIKKIVLGVKWELNLLTHNENEKM